MIETISITPRICIICGKSEPEIAFYPNKKRRQCKACIMVKWKEGYYLRNATKFCRSCNRVLPRNCFTPGKKYTCKDCEKPKQAQSDNEPLYDPVQIWPDGYESRSPAPYHGAW